MQDRAVLRQAQAELRHERAGERKLGLRHVRHHDDELRRIVLRHLLQAVHPQVGQIAIRSRERFSRRVMRWRFSIKPKPQHDGNGPQLAEFQDVNRLIGSDEGARAVRRRSAHRRAKSIRARCHKRAADRRRARSDEAGQLPAVAARQVPPGHLDLFFDQIEVVQHPLGGRSEAVPRIHAADGAVEGAEIPLVRIQAGQQAVRLPVDDDLVVQRPGRARAGRVARTLNNSARKGGSTGPGRGCRVFHDCHPVARFRIGRPRDQSGMHRAAAGDSIGTPLQPRRRQKGDCRSRGGRGTGGVDPMTGNLREVPKIML